MEMECVMSQEHPKRVEMEMDVTEPEAAIESVAANADEEENNVNTSEIDMLQEHVYSNDDGSVELETQINVDENTILLPVAGENGLNADDPAISFTAADFLQEEEQVLDPMMGTNMTVDPVISARPKRTPSQVPKKRRDAVMVKYEPEDSSPEKVKKRRGRKPGCKVVNGQVVYQDDEKTITPAKSNPKAKLVVKPVAKPVKKDDGSVNDSQCRVCKSGEDLINAFKKEYTKTYAEKLMALCPAVSIQRKDFLPQFICRICVSSVNAAFALKTQCERTDAELRERLEKSIKKVRRPVAKNYVAPESDPEEFPDPPMDHDFKLSDATPPSADDSDSDYGKPLAKRRTRRRTRKVSNVGTTPKVVKSENKPNLKPLRNKAKLTSPLKETKSPPSVKEEKSTPSMKEAKTTPPRQENKLTPPSRRAIKPDPDLNMSLSPEPDLEATGFSSGSEEDYSPPKKRRQKSANKSGVPRDVLTCRICKETMASKDELKQHKKAMHSDHECELCGRKFRMMCSLKSHMEKHTKSTDLKCGQCEKHFPNKTERRKHMIDVHKESPAQFICEKCKRAFTSELRLLKHNESRCPGFETSHAKKNKGELESMAMGKDLFKCVAPLTTTYWSDSFSD